MNQQIITELCVEAKEDTLYYSDHYRQQTRRRPTPSRTDIVHILCDDAPEVIDNDTRGNTLLIWGTAADGRIGHVLCGYYPEYRVITAYFPGETEPYKWVDSNYRVRRSGPEE